MDTSIEKKWFIYLGDHHEGPFSLDEVETKMTEGLVSPTTFVWSEGMNDWAPMTSVNGLEKLVQRKASTDEPPARAAAQTTIAATPLAIQAVRVESSPVIEGEKTDDLDLSDLEATKHPIAPDFPAENLNLGTHRAKTTAAILALLFIIVGVSIVTIRPLRETPAVKAVLDSAQEWSQPYLLGLADRFPKLGIWISPIPQLADVASEEFEELKAAARMPLDRDGPAVAIALSKADLAAPFFYIASNLPDGAQFDVTVEGIPETLLNQLSFSAQVRAIVNKKMGRSAAVRFPDGKLVPRGQYRVSVVSSADQPAAVKAIQAVGKLIATKSYFLGGAKDETYANRLREFHDKLRAKAESELSELKQFAMTLETQRQATVNEFNQLRRGGRNNLAKKKAWSVFHAKWAQFSGQMNASFTKWTPEALESEYFYGIIYQLTQQTAQSVERLHQLHQSYFSPGLDPRSFEIQVGEATSQSEHAVSLLKARIDQAEKIPPTPNGMPRKEGL